MNTNCQYQWHDENYAAAVLHLPILDRALPASYR